MSLLKKIKLKIKSLFGINYHSLYGNELDNQYRFVIKNTGDSHFDELTLFSAVDGDMMNEIFSKNGVQIKLVNRPEHYRRFLGFLISGIKYYATLTEIEFSNTRQLDELFEIGNHQSDGGYLYSPLVEKKLNGSINIIHPKNFRFVLDAYAYISFPLRPGEYIYLTFKMTQIQNEK